MSNRNVASKHSFVLVTPSGDSYVIQGVEIRKCGGTYGYNLVVVLESGDKANIGWSMEKEDLLPIRETIVEHMKNDSGEPLDMRGRYQPNPEYVGYHGCTIVAAG